MARNWKHPSSPRGQEAGRERQEDTGNRHHQDGESGCRHRRGGPWCWTQRVLDTRRGVKNHSSCTPWNRYRRERRLLASSDRRSRTNDGTGNCQNRRMGYQIWCRKGRHHRKRIQRTGWLQQEWCKIESQRLRNRDQSRPTTPEKILAKRSIDIRREHLQPHHQRQVWCRQQDSWVAYR